MGRPLCVVALAGLVIFSASVPGWALVGFGARVGFDYTTVDAERVSFPLGSGTVSLDREEIARPLILGATLETGLLPMFDVEIAGEVAIKKYEFDYTTKSDGVYFSRVSALVTLKKNLLSFPPVAPVMSIYAGVGGGLHYVTPVISRKLVEDKLGDPADVLEPDDVIEYNVRPGAHGVVGLKLKPAVLPVGLSAEARYVVKAEGDFAEPGSHLSVYGGLSLGF